MENICAAFKDLLTTYQTWVTKNPNLVTDMETASTWSLYFVAGKVNKSPIVSELVYSLSKLLSFYNDNLIRKAYGNEVEYYSLREQIKLWLTMINYWEVFVELAVRYKFGSRGKWTVVTLIQLFKCSTALILLFKYKEFPIVHPPIASLQRNKFTEGKETNKNDDAFFILKRSGRIIRKVEGAPPVAFRNWEPIKVNKEPNRSIELNDMYCYAESLHILKPLIHLASMNMLGQRSWKQWLVSLGIDLVTLNIYRRHMKELTYDQRLEISRRNLGFVLYLLRSPMYNCYSKNVIEGALKSSHRVIPFLSFITNPLLQYLNHWQDIYFYMWSS